jgi:hypothetical protein
MSKSAWLMLGVVLSAMFRSLALATRGSKEPLMCPIRIKGAQV